MSRWNWKVTCTAAVVLLGACGSDSASEPVKPDTWHVHVTTRIYPVHPGQPDSQVRVGLQSGDWSLQATPCYQVVPAGGRERMDTTFTFHEGACSPLLHGNRQGVLVYIHWHDPAGNVDTWPCAPPQQPTVLRGDTVRVVCEW